MRVGKVEQKGEEDDLAFARNREEMDAIANKEKEDRLIITVFGCHAAAGKVL